MYEQNVMDSTKLRIDPALLTNLAGGYERGVVLFSGTCVRNVIPEDEAYRLASQIIDAIEHHKTNA
ncbi:hypothetical protein ACX80W_01740 [Arthrobacter sp. TMN-37]